MSEMEHFDFWFAVHNTQMLRMPRKHLETFGTTNVKYLLIAELMDTFEKIRVREGLIQAFRPQIITPQSYADDSRLEGFGEEARAYANWLRRNEKELHILKYGFQVKKQEVQDYIVTDNVKNVADRVLKDVDDADDPNSAVLLGVDQPWEVCLLKLMVEVVQHSVEGNYNDLKENREILANRKTSEDIRREVDEEFMLAEKHPGRIKHLAALLKKHGLFSKYEDRFFSLVNSKK